MRRVLTVLILCAMPVLALATNNGNKNHHNNFNNHHNGGGDPSSRSDSSAKAYGGTSNAYAVGVGGAGGDARALSQNDLTQGMVGINGQRMESTGSGNETSVVVNGDSVKKQDVPAIAPSAVPGDPTATCIATWAGSGAYGGIISIGGSGYVYSKPCLWGEVARSAAALGQDKIAALALVEMFNQTLAITGSATPDSNERPAAVRDDGFAGLEAIYD